MGGSAAASSRLLLRHKDATLRSACARGFHGSRVGRSNLVVVMNVLAEKCPLQLRSQHIRQQQVGHRLQAVPGRRMASDIDSKITELLNQAPNFGTVGANLGSNFRSADHASGMIDDYSDSASQAGIRLCRSLLR